jgi:hypothetical protein
MIKAVLRNRWWRWRTRARPHFSEIPVGVSAFGYELYQAPRSWSEKAYPKLVYYKKHDVGGHFAAREQPHHGPVVHRPRT